MSVNPDTISDIVEPVEKAAKTSSRTSSSWDIKNGPKNYVMLASAQIGAALFSFASIWIITRFLGSEGYGGVFAVIAASQVAQVLVNWTASAVVRFGVDEFIETGKIARAFWVRLLVTLANLAIVSLFAPLWFPPMADWLKLSPGAFWLVMAHFAITVIWVHIQYGLQGIKMLPFQGFLMMTERLVTFVGLAILASSGRLEFTGAVVCYIAAPAIMTFIGAFKLQGYIFRRFSLDGGFVKEIVYYSAPLLPLATIGYFSGSYLDAAFVSKFLSTKDLGLYAVATQVSGVALQFPTLLSNLLLPFFITVSKEAQDQKTVRYFKHAVPTMLLGWGLFCSLGSVFAHYLIPLIFGSDFSESVMPLWILLAISSFALPIFLGYGAYASAKSKTYIIMVAGIFAGVTNVVLNIVLIPIWGTAGCAWATGATYLVSVLTSAILLNRILQLDPSWTFLAMVPAVASAIGYFLTGNPWEALAICVGSSGVVLYWKKESLFEFVKLANAFRPGYSK